MRKPDNPLPRVKPMHVTLRIVRGTPSLQKQLLLNRVRKALPGARVKAEEKGAELQIVHFGIEGNHLHSLVERRDLATPTEVRNVLSYILDDTRKHVRHVGHGAYLNSWTSGEGFDGWSEPVTVYRSLEHDTEPWAPVRAWTWLARTGWRRRGWISPFAAPGGATK